MRNAFAATAMLLAGVATAATAQDTTAAGRRQGADSIARSGQSAQADSAWKQGGQRGDSARAWGRDSLPQGAGQGRGEQDAVNPKLDAQGRPMQRADSSRNPGMTGERADSSRNRNPSGTSSSIQTMEPTGATPSGATGGTTTTANADGTPGYRTYDDWKRDMDEVVRDRQVARQHGVDAGQSASATGGQQGAWVDSTRRYDPQDSTKAGQRASSKAGKAKTTRSQGTSGERQGSYETGAPGQESATSQPEPRKSPDASTGRTEVQSSTTTGQQGNAANAPGNRDGTSSSANTGGTSSTSGSTTSGGTTSGSTGTTPR
jgi:hypothetical protein